MHNHLHPARLAQAVHATNCPQRQCDYADAAGMHTPTRQAAIALSGTAVECSSCKLVDAKQVAGDTALALGIKTCMSGSEHVVARV